jgi:hypothetical protein
VAETATQNPRDGRPDGEQEYGNSERNMYTYMSDWINKRF